MSSKNIKIFFLLNAIADEEEDFYFGSKVVSNLINIYL